jgi:hypothetical protein
VKVGALLTLLALCCGVQPASAETRSVSYSQWTITPSRITAKIVLPVAEAQRLTGVDVPVLTTRKLEDYLTEHIGVSAGADCAPIDQGYDIGTVDPLAVGPGLYGFEIFFDCANAKSAERVLKNTVLFERVPGHVNFARLQNGETFATQIFAAGREAISVPVDGAPPNASLYSYVRLGWLHLLRSPDRLLVLLGLLLLVRRRIQLGHLAGGLVLGYALALAVGLTGWVIPRMPLLEAFVGFVAVLLSIEIVARNGERRNVAVGAVAVLLILAVAAALTSGASAALAMLGAALIAAGFLPSTQGVMPRGAAAVVIVVLLAFLDGFVLPSELAPLQLTGRETLPMALGFDVGAVAAAMAVASLVAAAALFAKRRNLSFERPLVNDVAAALLGGFGAFWVLSRMYA